MSIITQRELRRLTMCEISAMFKRSGFNVTPVSGDISLGFTAVSKDSRFTMVYDPTPDNEPAIGTITWQLSTADQIHTEVVELATEIAVVAMDFLDSVDHNTNTRFPQS